MSATFYRYDGTVRTVLGEAISGASIAVLTQPADTSTTPGSPLAVIYAGPNSNAPTVTAASWLAGTATLTLNTVPADVVVGSFVQVSAVLPVGYNGIVQLTAVNTVAKTIQYLVTVNPGAYVSGGVLRTSALPNPFTSDNLGNYFFYTLPGIYTVQIYNLPALPGQQLILADQNVVAGGGSGSVTSVALSLPAEFTVTGSPVSASGTLTATWATELANRILAGPASGPAATPGFRALVPADFPGSVGTVTSVALTVTVPAILSQSVTGSPVTSAGTLAIILTLVNQAANTVFAGATSGGPSTPSFRALVPADFPGTLLQSVSVSLSSAQLLALLGTPVTLVAAPGAGFTIVPLFFLIEFFGGAIAYTDAGGAVSFSIGSASQALGSNGIFLVTVTPNKAIQRVDGLVATDTAGNPPTDENAPLRISKATNNFAAGNGTAKVLVQYLILPTT